MLQRMMTAVAKVEEVHHVRIQIHFCGKGGEGMRDVEGMRGRGRG